MQQIANLTLQRASQQYQPNRICDLQATVLVEIYSVFKARQLSAQFSRSFEQVYNQVCRLLSMIVTSAQEIDFAIAY
jgi:hypothetical protein